MQRTLTGRLELTALYRCEACGKTNIGPVSLKMKQTYDDTAWTSASRAQQRSDNEWKLRQSMSMICSELIDGGNAKIFPKAQLSCSGCSQCKKRAPWARLEYTWTKLGMALLGIGLVFLLIAAFGRDLLDLDHISYRVSYQCRQYVPLALGVLGACAAAWGIHFTVMMNRIKKSMNTCPPLFAPSAKALRQKAQKYEAYSDIDWSKCNAG